MYSYGWKCLPYVCNLIFISVKILMWFFCLRISLRDTDRHASLSLRLIKMAAPCCNLAMASCLCCLSNRKWPPFCCCCRLKAHRLAWCLKPPFWSQRTESRQQRREGLKGGHGAEVRDSTMVVMAKEQWGRWPGREKELKDGDHTFGRLPSSCPLLSYERRLRRASVSMLGDWQETNKL